MKRQEKEAARRLRQGGESVKVIAEKVGASKASVSMWVRDIALTSNQRKQLTRRGHSVDAVEKRRIVRIGKTLEQRRLVMEQAAKDISKLSTRELWLVGIALYWGEGGKAYHGSVRISNSDSGIIQTMIRFFREVCHVPTSRLRGQVHTYSHLNRMNAEQYWSKVSGIPIKHFYKTYVKKSIASKNKRDSLPNGTFQVYVNDTRLFFTIMGWIDKVRALSSAAPAPKALVGSV